MPNQPLSGNIPDHLQGRGSLGGPTTGGLIGIPFIGGSTAVAVANVILYAVAPCNCRALSFTYATDVNTGGVTLTLTNTTQSLALFTAVALTADAANRVDSPTLTNRNIARSDLLTLTAPAGTSAQGLTGTLWCFTKGHVLADSAND